jgi:hypothetical protein
MPAAVKRYMDHYLGLYRDATGGKIGEHGLRAMMFDSWEASFANWTPADPGRLQAAARLRSRRRGCRRLAGYVVDTPERSDAFLWDWRRTLQQLLKVHHYEQLTETLHGIRACSATARRTRKLFAAMGDGMEMKAVGRHPDGRDVAGRRRPGPDRGGATSPTWRRPASVAHIYGQNLAAAEVPDRRAGRSARRRGT